MGRHLAGAAEERPAGGSIIAVIATDAPLLPHQLKRLARRVSLGIARTGAVVHNGSGDIFLALSTANREALQGGSPVQAADFLANTALDPLFTAVVEASEEAVVDALVANETMTGPDGTTIQALPHEALRALLAARGALD